MSRLCVSALLLTLASSALASTPTAQCGLRVQYREDGASAPGYSTLYTGNTSKGELGMNILNTKEGSHVWLYASSYDDSYSATVMRGNQVLASISGNTAMSTRVASDPIDFTESELSVIKKDAQLGDDDHIGTVQIVCDPIQ